MSRFYTSNIYQRGVGMMEIIVSVAVITVSVGAIALAVRVYINVQEHNTELTQAALLVEETGEAMQVLRDESWANNIAALSLDTPYFLYWDGSTYSATTSTSTDIGLDFYRVVTLSAVERDGSDDITETGTLDENTRHVDIRILSKKTGEVVLASEMLIHNAYEE